MVNENFKLSIEQVNQYFQRISLVYNCDWEPTIDNLFLLQNNHIAYIPYENLSILLREPISLEGEDLFDKIIIRKRGGYCFEVNGLYTHLLKALGYEVVTYNCRFIFEEKGIQLRRHRIMKVVIGEEAYLTDVSFRNESARFPLKLIYKEVQSDGIAEYKFEEDAYYGIVLWQKLSCGEWKKVYGFEEVSQSETDFFMPNYFCETHPKSPFIDGPHMSICPYEQHITISNNFLTISHKNKIVKEKRILSKDEFIFLCKEYFNISPEYLENNKNLNEYF